VDAMAAALSTDLASGSASGAGDSGLVAPWRPKGILVSSGIEFEFGISNL